MMDVAIFLCYQEGHTCTHQEKMEKVLFRAFYTTITLELFLLPIAVQHQKIVASSVQWTELVSIDAIHAPHRQQIDLVKETQ